MIPPATKRAVQITGQEHASGLGVVVRINNATVAKMLQGRILKPLVLLVAVHYAHQVGFIRTILRNRLLPVLLDHRRRLKEPIHGKLRGRMHEEQNVLDRFLARRSLRRRLFHRFRQAHRTCPRNRRSSRERGHAFDELSPR